VGNTRTKRKTEIEGRMEWMCLFVMGKGNIWMEERWFCCYGFSGRVVACNYTIL